MRDVLETTRRWGVTVHSYLDEPFAGVEIVSQRRDREGREEMVQGREVVLKGAEDEMSIHVR
jgi:biotin carboxylase